MKTERVLYRPSTINPYRSAAGEVLRRLRWDLNPEAWRSRHKLRRLGDSHPGERCVVLCNGPSLLRTNLDLAQRAYTFGLNKINLLFDKNPFRPSAIVAVNPFVTEQNAAFFRTTDILLFLDSTGLQWVPPRENTVYLHSMNRGFARDCSISVNQGSTVTYVALQLAFHMGFASVALVGCDHDFVESGRPHAVAISGASDPNHFDPNYFAGGVRWNYPDLLDSELSYRRARDVFEQEGRRVFNATVGGKLEVFPRIDLEEFLFADAPRVPGRAAVAAGSVRG